MKKTLIRAISFFLTLSLLTGLLIPFASAIEYEGVESMTVDATAALLIDLDTDQVLYEQAADEQRYPASITKIMTALLTLGGLTLDSAARTTWKDGNPVELTAREFDLLELLMKNPNRVYSREQLLNLVWGYEYTGEYRTVDVHIRRLREKVEQDPAHPAHLCTKWGVGYYFKEA